MKFISRPITALALAALFGVGLMAPVRAEPITSTATLHYVTGGAERELRSNTTVLTPTPTETASVATFLRPTTTPDAKAIPVAGAQCRLASGAYQPLSNETGEVTTSAIPSTNFHAGENLYFSVEDGDRNANATVLDEVEVTVTAGEGDREIIRMLETGPNTGVFAGQLPTQVGAIATPYNCVLTVTAGSGVKLSYGDTRHREDVSQVQALIDPFGVTFDSETGEALNGVRVTLIDDATSQPAAVFGDDGVSAYPSSMLSGETVRDAGGTIYAGVKGSYRFPLVASGRYRLLVEPTEGWRAPSEADPASLAQLDAPSGDKYQIDAPSFGAAFNLVGPAPLRVDLPLDPVRTGLLLDKSASVSEASVGDFVQYRLTLENPNTRGALAGARIRDELPQGVRLQPGSVRIDGKPGSATVSGDTLDISVGALRGGAKVQIAYVVRLEPSVRNGLLVTRANAATAIGLTSNEARATVRVTPPLMAGVLTLIGRVTEGACGTVGKGVGGVRVLLEDGAYTVTDDEGLYHFEGVRPGVHVVQLDVARLAAGLKPMACGSSNRSAGRTFSQFVDAGGGGLWRGDFRLQRSASSASSAPSATETVASVKNTAAADDDAKAAGAEIDFLTDATPGVDWLFPQLDHNPRAPALRVAIKHAPGQTVVLSINGRPVDPLSFDGAQTREDKTVAVSVWRGIPLIDGANRLVAQVSGGSGPPVRLERQVHYANTPARATLAPKLSKLSADGVNRPVIAVRFTDAAGRPVRAGASGSFRVDPPYRAASELDAEQQRQLAGLERYATAWRVEGDDGVALIPLAPTTQTGSVNLTFDLPTQREVRSQSLRAWLEPGQQDWVVVGFAAGTVGHATLRDKATPIPPSASDAVSSDGQVSLFAKGRISGDWLLTIAYDSEKQRDRDRHRSLTSVIDPGRYYTIYGDGSEQAYEASSAKKLFLRLDRKQFYALFGDFETGLTDTELSRYARSVTGVKAERQGEVLNATAFAAKTDLRYGREELQGSGLASLYQLARRDIVLNSDRLRIETRDRFRSERVLEVRELTRHIDYDINYDTGGLTFREPILSRDRDGNPVFIVAEYETVGAAGEQLNAGARVTATVADGRAVLGATAVHDEADRTRTDLIGVDAKVQVWAGGELRLELAGTRGGVDTEPDAPIRTGVAYLAELEHRGVRLDALAYVREQQAEFGLGQQNVSEIGSRKIGADLRYDLSEHLTGLATGYHETFDATGGTRELLEGSLEYETERTTFRLGGRHVADRVLGSTLRSDQIVLGASRRLLNRRLELTGEKSFGLGGEGESVDFPDRTRVGAAYALREDVRLIASHEVSAGEAFDAANTQVGLDVTPWGGAQLAATLNQAGLKENGSRTFAQFGLRQSLTLGERWSADLSLDSGRTLAGRIDPALAPNPLYRRAQGGSATAAGLVEDFWAVSAGGTYRSEQWSWTGRAEVRDGSETDRWAVNTGVLRQTEAGIAFAAGGYASRVQDELGGSATQATANLSWAYRPLESRWSLLDKLEMRVDEYTTGAGSTLLGPTIITASGENSLRRLLNSLAVNYSSTAGRASGREFQASFYYGSKYVFDRFDDADYAGYTDVLGLEVRQDVSRLFDVGFNASVQHAWEAGAVNYSWGPSIGISPVTNAWLSVGYNVVGFDDRDGDGTRYTRQGPYAALRFKFDQQSFEDLRQGFGRRPRP